MIFADLSRIVVSTMIDAIKHTLYAGLGATVVTVERIEAGLQDLVEKGKISAEEARETAKKISEDSKKEYKDARKSMESAFEDMLKDAPVARTRDLEALKKRVSALEKELKELKKDSAEDA